MRASPVSLLCLLCTRFTCAEHKYQARDTNHARTIELPYDAYFNKHARLREGKCELGSWVRHPVPRDSYVARDALAGQLEVDREQRQHEQPSKKENFTEATLYRWRPFDPGCMWAHADLKSTCHLVKSLDIGRILFVGDSLSYLQFMSFVFLLGLDHGSGKAPGSERTTDGRQSVSISVPCDAGIRKPTFELHFVRNHYLLGTSNTKCYAPHAKGCMSDLGAECNRNSCMPWVPLLNKGPRTLLVLNTGAHSHSTALYEASIYGAIKATAKLIRSRRDIVVFRTTPAGHPNCSQFSAPFVTLAEAQSRVKLGVDNDVTQKFSWHLFANFTRLLKTKIAELSPEYQVTDLKRSGGAMVLDVDPMTVLRGDGHRPQLGDCLHYYLPAGPVDSWNHLLISMLLQKHASEIARSIESLSDEIKAIGDQEDQ